MPTPTSDLIAAPPPSPVRVRLEPAHNAVHSLLLLHKSQRLSGLGEWVVRTVDAMTDEERSAHHVVIDGLYYAVLPDRSWPSFPAYVDHLAALNPDALRTKLLDYYAALPVHGEQVPMSARDALADPENYLAFLSQRFKTSHLDPETERRTFKYVANPPEMQSLIVTHLRHMWTRYLAAEWERVLPMLQDSVDAFQQVDFSSMTKLEAARFVTGQPLEQEWQAKVVQAEQIVFVPNAHVGPYLGRYDNGKTLGILFGPRLPEGAQIEAPELSRADVAVRLNALADDTRLRILKLIAERGELRSQDIMLALDLSQPAASRHLTQLSATGYLSERRADGGKCYRLNPERIEETLQAIAAFLLGKAR